MAEHRCTVCSQDAGPGLEFKFTHRGRFVIGPPVCNECWGKVQRGRRRVPDAVHLAWLDVAIARGMPDRIWLRVWLIGCVRGRLPVIG